MTDTLLAAVDEIIERHGNHFKREQAAGILRGLVGADQVERFLEQLVQVPGILSLGDGMYELPDNAEFCTRHREWRFAVGRLDLEEAMQLNMALAWVEQNMVISFGLATLNKRLKTALDSLERVGAAAPERWNRGPSCGG